MNENTWDGNSDAYDRYVFASVLNEVIVRCLVIEM